MLSFGSKLIWFFATLNTSNEVTQSDPKYMTSFDLSKESDYYYLYKNIFFMNFVKQKICWLYEIFSIVQNKTIILKNKTCISILVLLKLNNGLADLNVLLFALIQWWVKKKSLRKSHIFIQKKYQFSTDLAKLFIFVFVIIRTGKIGCWPSHSKNCLIRNF